MEESVKVIHTKNMPKFNFNLTISIPYDLNANIKKVLDVNSYVFDQKVECGNGKAILTGKVGVKVLYLDTDNMTNTLTGTSNFNETYSDSFITANTHLNMLNSSIVNTILSTDGMLKINCDVNVSPIAYINLNLFNNLQTEENMITKKQQVISNIINDFVNTKFEHTLNLETKDTINKVLCCNGYFTLDKVTPENNYAVVEGKLVVCLTYESTVGNETLIKEIKEESQLKHDIEIKGLTKDNLLDLSFYIDKGYEEISTELEENLSVITVKNSIKVCGPILKNVSVDVVDDVYSLNNEMELKTLKREYTKNFNCHAISEIIFNEITLSDNETAIDELVSNLNFNAEVTNSYLKDNVIILEGIVSSNLIYIDENKELKSKLIEVPFVINTKITSENLGCIHSKVSIMDTKTKVKRGTNIEMEYSLFLNVYLYQKETCELVDGFKVGKKLDFSKYDYQIFVAKQNETIWDVCKRIKVSPNDLSKYNKDLPLIMEGGEKIVIKR